MNQCVCNGKGESLAYKRPGHEFFMCSRISFLLTETHGKEKIGPATVVCFKLIRVI